MDITIILIFIKTINEITSKIVIVSNKENVI